MVHGGAGNTDATKTEANKKLTALLLEYAINSPALVEKIKTLIESKDSTVRAMNVGETSPYKLNDEELVETLAKDKDLLKTITDHLAEHPDEFKKLIEEASKDPVIIRKADGFGRAFYAAGGLALGATSVTLGLLLGPGLVAAAPFIGLGLVAFATIAAIGFALFSLFENKEKIGEKAKEIGKDVMHFLKNFIDKVPFRRSNAENFLKKFESKEFQEEYSKVTGKSLPDDAAFVKQYLSNEGGFKALENLIAEKNASNEKFILKDEKGEEVELTLDKLKALKDKGDSTFTKADNDKFIAQLDEFKLLMSEDNKDVRAQVEAEQDKTHERKNLQTFIPSSAGYHGSRASTALLSKIDPGKKRTGVEGFLKKASKLEKPFREGNGGLYEILEKAPYNLDRDTLKNLEKKGSELSNEGLDSLASSLNTLTLNQIKELNAKVNDLEKEQSKGPQPQTSEIKETPTQHAPGRTAGISTT